MATITIGVLSIANTWYGDRDASVGKQLRDVGMNIVTSYIGYKAKPIVGMIASLFQNVYDAVNPQTMINDPMDAGASLPSGDGSTNGETSLPAEDGANNVGSSLSSNSESNDGGASLPSGDSSNDEETEPSNSENSVSVGYLPE